MLPGSLVVVLTAVHSGDTRTDIFLAGIPEPGSPNRWTLAAEEQPEERFN